MSKKQLAAASVNNLLNIASVPMILWSKDLKYIDSNAQFKEHFSFLKKSLTSRFTAEKFANQLAKKCANGSKQNCKNIVRALTDRRRKPPILKLASGEEILPDQITHFDGAILVSYMKAMDEPKAKPKTKLKVKPKKLAKKQNQSKVTKTASVKREIAMPDKSAPIVETTRNSDALIKPVAAPTAQNEITIESPTILVIDDNRINRTILLEQLTSWKFDCAASKSGEEGLAVMRAALAQDIKLDCLVVDYLLEGMNGDEVVRQMKADPQLANIPTIILSSAEHIDEQKTFKKLGIDAQLTKPARSSLLLETITSVLNKAPRSGKVEPEVVESKLPPLPPEPPKPTENMREVRQPTVTELKQPTKNDGLDILICEDNEVNQVVFTQILQMTKYSFKIANNGVEGLEFYKKYNPRLILMDLSMPEKNGLETTKAIRELEAFGKHTPIIAITAHAIKGDADKCFEVGMDEYLTKPVSPDVLTETINKWLDSHKSKLFAS